MLWSSIQIAVSLVGLYYGAEFLVKGAGNLALRLGLSKLLIGLTVVAYGTSMPELAVSAVASLNGRGDIALGNVSGSNAFNIGFILGLAALISPMKAGKKLWVYDIPVMMGSVVLFLVFYSDTIITRIEALVFFVLAFSYTVSNIYLSEKEHVAVDGNVPDHVTQKIPVSLLFITGGIVIMVFSSDWLVTGATQIARIFHISEAVIAVTIVAAGTSMPEMATSVVAALKKESEIAVGNVIGSNIFNILLILGAAGLIKPIKGEQIGQVDLYASLIMGIVLWFSVLLSKSVNRLVGLSLMLLFFLYMAYIWPGSFLQMYLK